MNISNVVFTVNSAFIFSLIKNCKLNNINPPDSLWHLLEYILHGRIATRMFFYHVIYRNQYQNKILIRPFLSAVFQPIKKDVMNNKNLSKNQHMKPQPEISVIVPIYNAENYLARCLNSILNQTFKGFELLLINDGSSDDSLNICNTFALTDKRITVYNLKNGGVSAARQFGVEKAKGQYSIFIDADDWIDSNMLLDMYQIITNKQYDILICNYFINNNPVKEVQGIDSSQELIHNMLNSKIKGAMWNKLVKHSLYEQYNIKFPKNINFCEDVYVCMQLFLYANKIGYTEKAYYHYIKNPNSITKKLNKNIILQRVDFVYLATKFLLKNNMDKHWLTWHKLDLKWIVFSSGLFTFQEYKKIFPELFQEYRLGTHREFLKNVVILYLVSHITFWRLFKDILKY